MTNEFDRALREAARRGTVSEATRDRWVADALGDAAPRRSYLAIWTIAAAAVVLVGALIFVPKGERPEPTEPDARLTKAPPPQVRSAEERKRIAEQRARNVKALESADAKARIKRTKPGAAVCVVMGRVLIADTPEAAARRAHAEHPHARHRFVFRLDEDGHIPGDVILSCTPFQELSIGAWFLEQIGVRATRRDDREWTVLREGHEVVTAKERLEFDLATNPDGGYRETPPPPLLGLPVKPESLAPLVFNANFGLPRFEQPGRMIVEDEQHNWRSYRRYFVRIRHQGLGLDRWVDAIGSRSRGATAPGDWIAVNFGGYVFHALRAPAPEVARVSRQPLVVLRFKRGAGKKLHALFESARGALDQWSHHAIPEQQVNALDRYDRDGNLTGTLDLDLADETKLRAFLKR